MSNETAASETTPLRAADPDPATNVANNINNNSHREILVNHNNNYNSNSSTESHRPSVGDNNNTQQQQPPQQQQQQPAKDMDTNKRILCRVGLDILILLCVGFPILLFFLLGEPYKRGFFCDDESLKHPFHESTVRNWMLYIIGLVIPVGVILTVEILISQQKTSGSNRRYVFMNYDIPDWLIECYKKIGIFGFGAAISQLTTDIAKYSIGRLRPHFMAVCQPVMGNNNLTCDSPENAGKYITEFTCQGKGSSARMLKEMRLSFPSGHSSFTFYTMVYVALYLQSRMTWHGSKLLRHFLQFLFIMIAWYTALSRVSDYKHHWSDVLAGSLIGSLCALIVANYVSDLFQKPQTKPYLPRTNQDINNGTNQSMTVTTN